MSSLGINKLPFLIKIVNGCYPELKKLAQLPWSVYILRI